MAERMPALFIGHGNPILSVSAHWYIEDAAVTVSTAPRTIHDFGGFPHDLYQVQYPAPGDPDLAARVQKLLAHVPVRRDDRWGLDHGTWSVLRHVYPQADIPIFQWFNSALTKRNRPCSITKSASAWHSYEKKAFSSSVAATSCTTCMPMLGDGTHRSRTIGRSHLKLESASCSSRESTSRS